MTSPWWGLGLLLLAGCSAPSHKASRDAGVRHDRDAGTAADAASLDGGRVGDAAPSIDSSARDAESPLPKDAALVDATLAPTCDTDLTVTVWIENEHDLRAFEGCSAVQGDLMINVQGLSSLQGLEALTTVGGKLVIHPTDTLTSLKALGSLTSIGGDVSIQRNTALKHLEGLEGLETVGGSVTILDNPALVDVAALTGLRSVGGDLRIGYRPYQNSKSLIADLRGLENLTSVLGELALTGNRELRNLQGLEQLERLGGIDISENQQLGDIDALSNVREFSGSIVFRQNDALTSLKGLANAQGSFGRRLEITSNASLLSLEGLGGLKGGVEQLLVRWNPLIQDLDPLRGLVGVGDELEVAVNRKLVSIEGLRGVTAVNLSRLILTVSDDRLDSIGALSGLQGEVGEIMIYGLKGLSSLAGLEGLTGAGDLSLSGCKSLTSLSPLSGLSRVTGRFELTYNGVPQCEVDAFAARLARPGCICAGNALGVCE